MKRNALIAALFLFAAPAGAQVPTLDLTFLPPEVEPRLLCLPEAEVAAPQVGRDGRPELTDARRVEFLEDDIRRYQREDADRWFDFIEALIARRAALDEEFAGSAAQFARVDLYIDAGRMETLREKGLIDQLSAAASSLNNAQQLRLAQLYRSGIGVERDEAFAWSLIRDAAYQGHPDALMTIARAMLAGETVPDWSAPLDLTVTMAFSGMLGQMNAGVCDRAERIAREYAEGGLVAQNSEIAYAWHRFSADMGGRTGAWRVVEHHLASDGVARDNAEMLRYLQLAVERGFRPDEAEERRLLSTKEVDAEEMRKILGFDYTGTRARPSIAPMLQLSIRLTSDTPPEGGLYLDYLREISQMETAPGRVFTDLAREVLERQGRWAGEAEARDLLEEAVARADGEGMRLLAELLMRRLDDPAVADRVVDLLTEAATGFGLTGAMKDLDSLYRCRMPEAPVLNPAAYWSRAYRAAQDETLLLNPTDIGALDPYASPGVYALVQSQALDGRVASLANQVARIQLDPTMTERGRRIWADRIDGSQKALEEYAKLEFELASTVGDRRLALELLRRVYLNNGTTSALDLAIGLIESGGRDPKVAEEVKRLLTQAGSRGEGAAIRLLARLEHGTRTPREIYNQFAPQIEARGDFLALMFSIPNMPERAVPDYLKRAVALMNCGTKDIVELADANMYAGNAEGALHWQRVGLAMEHGNVLAKLRLSDQQVAAFGTGAAPDERSVYRRAAADGSLTAHRHLFRLATDPGLQTYDPRAAARHVAVLLDKGDAADRRWVQVQYRQAPDDVRTAIAEAVDLRALYLGAAEAGDVQAMLELALLLRDRAERISDLEVSARWLKKAADNGSIPAMGELGHVLAYGIGMPIDRQEAMQWLEKAAGAGDQDAARTARLLRLMPDG